MSRAKKKRPKHDPDKRINRNLRGMIICYRDPTPRDMADVASERCERWIENTNPQVPPIASLRMYEKYRRHLLENPRYWVTTVSLGFHDKPKPEIYRYDDSMNWDDLIDKTNHRIDGLKTETGIEKPNSILKWIEVRFIVI